MGEPYELKVGKPGDPPVRVRAGDSHSFPGDMSEAVARAVYGDGLVGSVLEESDSQPTVKAYTIWRANDAKSPFVKLGKYKRKRKR